jgi:uncharacterized protein YcfJ
MKLHRSPISRAALRIAALTSLAGLAACATTPTGPSMIVLPGSGKSFDQFRFDDASCRQYADQQIGGSAAAKAAEQQAVQSAVIGAAVGALAGAALGGSRGAGVGAGTGLVVGSAVGSSEANASGYAAQRRYDQAYVQCMYAAGHKVPVSGNMNSSRSGSSKPSAPRLPSMAVPAPPPPGAPPPPPPGSMR